MLYEMLTGRAPFEAETPLAVILKHIQEPLPPPSLHVAGLPLAIETVLLKALAKNPPQRFESVAEFLQAWNNALAQPEMATLRKVAIPLENAAPPSAPVSVPQEMQTGPAAPPIPIEPPPPSGSTRFRPSRKQLLIGCFALLALACLCLSGLFAISRIFQATNEENPRSERVSANVNDILAANAGMFVATWDGLAVWQVDAGWMVYHTADGLPDNPVNVLMEDNAGRVWLGTNAGIAIWEDGELWQPGDLVELGLYDVYGLLQDADGIFWICGNGGLARYNEAAADWQVFTMSNSNLQAYTLLGALQTEDGRLFFGSDSEGFLEFENGAFVTHRMENTPRAAAFWRILEDPQGNLWFVEEWSAAVDVLEPRRLRWMPEQPPILGEQCCPNPLLWDRRGQLWAGGDTGLWIFTERGNPIHLTVDSGLPSDGVQQVAFAPDDRSVWVGMNGGVAHLENEQIVESYTASESLPLFSNTALFISADGSVWFGGDNVVLQRLPDGQWQSFEEQWRVYTPQDGLPEYMGMVTGFAEDAQQRLWLVTDSSGAFRLEDGVWQLVADAPPASFTGVWRAPDGALWFGTYNSGAYRWRDGVWDVFSTAQGLIDARVNFIWVDRNGTVWFATGGGMSRYQP